MKEKLAAPVKHEALTYEEHELLPAHTTAETKIKTAEALKHKHESAQEARKTVAELNQQELAPDPLKRLEAEEKAAQPVTSHHITSQLKKITARRELRHIQRRLPAPQRALSKIIHQPVIRAVSEGAGKTVSRPSGLLGGGIFAFLGSSIYLYLTKHVGFKYNYFVLFIFLIAGFILGLTLELVVWMATASRRKTD